MYYTYYICIYVLDNVSCYVTSDSHCPQCLRRGSALPAAFANRLRNVHASGTQIMSGRNFENFKIFSAHWHAHFTTIYVEFTHWHATLHASAGTKFVRVKVA